MEITEKDVERLAALSKLRFSAEEKSGIKTHLENMLGHFETFAKINTDGVAPTVHVVSKVNVFREDAACASMQRELLLSNASDNDGECYVVPRVVE